MYEFTMYHYDIDEKLNVLRAHGFETYSWVDHRLNYSVPETCSRGNRKIWSLSKGYVAKLWHPELYIVNSLGSQMIKDLLGPMASVAISPSGRVIVSYATERLLMCTLRLHHFPDDTQECELTVGSYSFDANSVVTTGDHIVVHVPSMQDELVSNNQRGSRVPFVERGGPGLAPSSRGGRRRARRVL